MKIQPKQELTIEKILEKVGEFDIFRVFAGDFQINKAFCSVLRKDNSPSCSIKMGGDGRLRYYDYATGDKLGVVDFVMAKNQCNYDGALKYIDRAFGLGLSGEATVSTQKVISSYSKPILDPKRYTLIEVVTKKFTGADLAYWSDFAISRDKLRKHDVYSLREVWVNGKKQTVLKDELVFGYFYEGVGWKIYFPQREKGKTKWLSNIPLTLLENIDNIQPCKSLLVAKALKDRMLLEDIFPNIVNTQNETKGCFPQKNIELINSKAPLIYIAFDADDVGVKNSTAIVQENNWKWVNVPKKLLERGIKDFADMTKELGIKAVEKHFKLKGLI